jgi:hypothetical protein
MIDTLQIADRLKTAGLGEKESKQIATELLKSLEDAEIVTKPVLQAELRSLEVSLTRWIFIIALAVNGLFSGVIIGAVYAMIQTLKHP